MGSRPERPAIQGVPYARWIAIGGGTVLLVALIVVLARKPHGNAGVPAGSVAPAFAVPLAIGDVEGGPDIARRADEGERGRVPACRERGQGILNICELYEKRPVVLALFIDGGSCPAVLKRMQTAAIRFPTVSFAAVAVKGGHAEVRRLVGSEHLSIPVGFDRAGLLAGLYQMTSCPQLNFIEKGGVVQSRALLEDPPLGRLEARVRALVASSGGAGGVPAGRGGSASIGGAGGASSGGAGRAR